MHAHTHTRHICTAHGTHTRHTHGTHARHTHTGHTLTHSTHTRHTCASQIVFVKYSSTDVKVPDGDVVFVAQHSILATLS